MINILKEFFDRLFIGIFNKKKHIKLGLYGPPNGGKTTLANKICKDWLGEEMGTVSNIAHETREIQIKEQINICDGAIIGSYIKGGDTLAPVQREKVRRLVDLVKG